MSACFLESWKEDSKLKPITCLTCHDPHSPVEETGDKTLSAACVNCHESGVDRISSGITCSEPSVVAGTNTASCASCHMPLSGSTDIPNIRITDHFIRVPGRLSPTEAKDQTEFIRLASLINPTPDPRTKAEGFLTYYEQFTDRPGMLDSAQVYLKRAENELGQEGNGALTKSWIRLWHLQKDHVSVRRVAASTQNVPSDAWTYYRIGEAYAAIQDYNTAARWYQQALDLGPDHLRFMDKLGVALTQSGRIAEAIGVYDRLIQLNPLFETGLNNRGFARLMSEDLTGAEADFKSALAISPDMELALANLASLYLNTARQDEAKPLVRRLISLFPENPEYKQVWELVSR